ncbi:MAG: peptide-methionine (S)-S-oxide reductase MsrA [Ignavibacteria bacterium]|nr:peptide-methionine (S)-S-oxide reductase MsrA [Ignavibacteria bacterium]
MKTLLLTMVLTIPVGTMMPDKSLEKATLGGGCFWCVEAVYERVDGAQSVVSGYSGGTTRNPTYDDVCSGTTGHAEVVQITFDPTRVSFGRLLEIFWDSHDPTTMNRQGADVGTQYRSVIFYHTQEQKKLAEESKRKAASKFKNPIVTEVVPLMNFYKAEESHQDYFEKNPNAPYCVFVIKPKLDKLRLK